jgi:hypothetical protein
VVQNTRLLVIYRIWAYSVSQYGPSQRTTKLDGTCGETEVQMTFKVADIANEAQLVEIAERLSDALSGEQTPDRPVIGLGAEKHHP